MSAIITEKDDLYIWGEFLGEIIDMMNQEFHLLHKVILKASTGNLQGHLVNISDRRRIDRCGLKTGRILAKTGYITMSVGTKHIGNLTEELFERFLLARLSFWSNPVPTSPS